MAEKSEWQETDLMELVKQQADESSELDFKESGALQQTDGKRRELGKDVSALANSAGGTLIYGIVEDQETHKASSLDGGSDPQVISKEWVEQVINSHIQPRLSGVRIHQIELTTQRPGKVAYAVDVPQGSTAHQASDKRYYKRFNFESVPMEHYEIIDVLNRAETPNMELQFLVDGRQEGLVSFETRDGKTCSPSMDIWLANQGDAGMAEHCQCQLFLPSHLEVNALDHHITVAGRLHRQLSPFASDSYISAKGPRDELSYLEVRLGADDGPTFGGERRPLATLSFCYTSTVDRDEVLYLIWRVRAPGTRPRTGCLVFEYRMRDWYMNPVSLDWLEERDIVVSLAS